MTISCGSGNPELLTPPVRPSAIRAWASFITALAISMAQRRGLGPSVVRDLSSYGWIGLLEAMQRFDASLGVPFPGYAYPRVNGAMLDGIRRMSPMPRRLHLHLLRTTSGAEALADARFRLMHEGALALTSPRQGPDEQIATQQESLAVRQALERLGSAEQHLVRLLYGLDTDAVSGSELARRMNLHRSGLSRRRKSALDQLRRELRTNA